MWLVILVDKKLQYTIDFNTRIFNKKLSAEKYCEKLNKKYFDNELNFLFYTVKEIKKGD